MEFKETIYVSCNFVASKIQFNYKRKQVAQHFIVAQFAISLSNMYFLLLFTS
ncbi:hypothetical protein HanRHA438_Chr10g0462671 [Helianthus annuus]|nr:hypothetical protein HanRHA438_Chr10g0462671 [Helianthus annuus]